MSDALYSRIAALEAENAQLRSRNTPTAIKQQLVSNPKGFMASLQMTPEEFQHVQRVTVADALGDQAPPDMRMYAAMGPQIAQTSQLAASIQELSRRMDEMVVAPRKAEEARESLKALIADKVKYPYLAATIEKSPALLDAKMKGRSGDVAAIAQELEAEAKSFAEAYGFKPAQPASENADTTQAQSTQGKPAPLAGASNGDVPPLPGAKVGPLTPEEDKRIQEAIMRKHGLI